MIRHMLQQLMYGRSGADQLSNATAWAAVIVWTVYFFTSWLPLYAVALALVIYTFYRIFSRRIDKRRAENAKYLNLIRPLRRRLSAFSCRLRDKEHRYFRCPNCGQQMRVPRGKGRIQVTCRSCGITFEEKS